MYGGQARTSLVNANALYEKSPKSDKFFDAARRSVALSNEAINISKAHLESVTLEVDLPRRRAEMAEVEAQAQKAEARADAAREKAEKPAARYPPRGHRSETNTAGPLSVPGVPPCRVIRGRAGAMESDKKRHLSRVARLWSTRSKRAARSRRPYDASA